MLRGIFMRRQQVVFFVGLLALIGCSSSEHADLQVPPKTEVVASLPLERAAWSEETLAAETLQIEEGFRSLSFADFDAFFAKPPASRSSPTWKTVHDAIVCFGKPKGYLFTKETFQDFTLKLEFRFAPPVGDEVVKDFNPNTGVLVFVTEPHKQWPKSLEVQGKFAELCSIKPNGGAAPVELQEDAAARDSARKPVGEWNEIEIIAKAGAITAKLNGTTISTSQPGELTSGAIGLQSEDFEVHFRRLRIQAESSSSR